MSANPYFYIEKYDVEKDEWRKVTIYTKDEKGKFVEVDVWPWNGTHELFNVLGYERSGAEYEFDNVHYGLPKNCSEEIVAIYKSCCWTDGDYEYKPDVKWFNYADAKLFTIIHPKFKDYEAMDSTEEEVYMDNPVMNFLDRVMTYVTMADEYFEFNSAPSDIRIIGWVS